MGLLKVFIELTGSGRSFFSKVGDFFKTDPVGEVALLVADMCFEGLVMAASGRFKIDNKEKGY